MSATPIPGMSSLAAYWFQFFLDAGIPPSDAGSYAVAFTENRIQRSMMNDLSKDYLNDMGITVMGDTIAILKHAKSVYQKDVREQVLKCSGLSSTTANKASSHNSSQSAATVPHKSAAVANQKPAAVPQKTAVPQTSHAACAAVRNQVDMAAKGSNDSTKDRPTSTATSKSDNSNLIRLKPSQMEEVPVKKSRRVFPEHEGPYKITMPAGTTDKTRKLLAQQSDEPLASTNPESVSKSSSKSQISGKTTSNVGKSPAQALKRTADVFSRLGKEMSVLEDSDSSVSSRSPSPEVITDNRTQRQSLPQKSVAQRKTDADRKPAATKTAVTEKQVVTRMPVTQSSIFSRLGDKVAAKRSVSWQDGEDCINLTVSSSPPKKPFIMVPVTANKDASKSATKIPKQSSDGIFAGGSSLLETKSARDRLGGKSIGAAESGKTGSSLSGRLGVKACISTASGAISAGKSSSNTSVTSRLGTVTSTSTVKPKGTIRGGSGIGEEKPVVSSTTQDEPQSRRLGTLGGEIDRVGIRKTGDEISKIGSVGQRLSLSETARFGGHSTSGEVSKAGIQRYGSETGSKAGSLGVASGRSSVFSRLGKAAAK